MKKLNLYLAGNMTPNTEYYNMWTDDFEASFDEQDFECSKATIASDESGKFIVHHDLARLKRCDILIANLSVKSSENHLTGLVVEIYEAYKQNKNLSKKFKVFIFGEGELRDKLKKK